jgi:MFS transporter, PHS family, inorganic phosphate transporter
VLVLLAGTAGCWFLPDYAYCGNTISTPQIIALITPHASQTTTIAIQLVIGLVPGMTTAVAPFLLAYRISYFFTEFGPNVTTFVLPGELFPTRFRATGHGISAGIGKLGAFIGVFLFPVLQHSLGLRGTLPLTAGTSVLGALLTLVLPKPSGGSLEEISGEADVTAAAEDAIRDAGEPAPAALLACRLIRSTPWLRSPREDQSGKRGRRLRPGRAVVARQPRRGANAALG